MIALGILFSVGVSAQKSNLQINLNPDGKTYIKGAVRANFWLRHYQANPGTQLAGQPISQLTDFSIRRLRMNLQAQLTPRLFFYSNFGGNNIHFSDQKKMQIAPLDLYFEYAFAPEIAVGMGEIGWGASRGAMRSSKTMMGLDTPLFTLFTVNKNDDLARSLGGFAKGRLGKYAYVLTVKNPVKMDKQAQEGKVDFSKNTQKQYSAYLKYDFWQPESFKTSYSLGAGTYIGQKKIFNIGIGGVFQSQMMSEKIAGTETFYDYKNLSAELFLDTPLSPKNNALTLYAAYFHTDFGRDYLRMLGANDPADALPAQSLNGSGNDFPMMGTGNTYFLQVGYLLPKSEKYAFRVQPHLSVQHSVFHALKQPVTVYDLGVNCFFKGHDQKLTLSYQNRPIFNFEKEVSFRKGMLVLQYQVEIN